MIWCEVVYYFIQECYALYYFLLLSRTLFLLFFLKQNCPYPCTSKNISHLISFFSVIIISQVSRRETFRPDGYSGTIFRSTERQRIIDFVIRSKIKGEKTTENIETEKGVFFNRYYSMFLIVYHPHDAVKIAQMVTIKKDTLRCQISWTL